MARIIRLNYRSNSDSLRRMASFDKVQLIDQLVRAVSLTCAFMIPAAIAFVAARRRYKKVRESLPPLGADGRNVIAIYSCEKAFLNPGRNLVYEAVGRLQFHREGIDFMGEWNGGGQVRFAFSANNARVAWVGRTWRTMVVAWFLIEQNGVKHYFSSDAVMHGPRSLGKFKSSAHAIFQEVAKVLPPKAF